MIRIDFIGAPGCGKTTLVNKFVNSKLIDEAYKLSKARKLVLGKHFALKPDSSKSSRLSRWKKNLLKKVNPSFDKPKVNAFLASRMAQFDSLLTVILLNLSRNSTSKKTYLKFKRLEWFTRILEDVLIVSEFAKDSVILCDESLSSKLYQNDFGMVGKDLDHSLRNTLLPRGVVYVHCDREVILDRLISRKKTTVAHSVHQSNSMSKIVDDELIQANMVVNELLEQKVFVLKVDSTESINSNLEKIKQFIQQMKRY